MADADAHTPPKKLMESFTLRCNDFNQSKHIFHTSQTKRHFAKKNRQILQPVFIVFESPSVKLPRS